MDLGGPVQAKADLAMSTVSKAGSWQMHVSGESEGAPHLEQTSGPHRSASRVHAGQRSIAEVADRAVPQDRQCRGRKESARH